MTLQEALIERLQHWVYEYTENAYSHRYSSADYSHERDEAERFIDEIKKIADMADILLPQQMTGYIGITYDIYPEDDDD